jgi:hypothetical protein
MLSTVDLLIKVTYFVKKENKRSKVLSLPSQKRFPEWDEGGVVSQQLSEKK